MRMWESDNQIELSLKTGGNEKLVWLEISVFTKKRQFAS